MTRHPQSLPPFPSRPPSQPPAQPPPPAETGAALAQPPDHRRVQPVPRPAGAVGVGQDDEVVLRAVADQHPVRAHGLSSLALVGRVRGAAVPMRELASSLTSPAYER